MCRYRILLAALVMAMATAAWADGLIVPTDPNIRVRGNWSVKYHKVKMTVRDQIASVTIDQEFVNNSRGMMEVEYLFPIPPGAAIDGMTLVVDGKEFRGKVLEAKEARRIYEDIVRRKKDPALLEYVGYGLFKTSAFPLQPGKPAKVLIHYNHVCKRDRGIVEVFYPLNTEKFSAKAIDEVSVTVDVKSKEDITAVYSPTHDLKIERKDSKHVVACYEVKNAIPAIDFQMYYRSADEHVGATLLTYQPESDEDGYFLMLASPNPRTAKTAIQPKNVVLVVDHSGSMAEDDKIEQVKTALRQTLKSLNDEDHFNVVAYNDAITPFFKEIVPANKDNIAQALKMVDRLEAMGGTDIGGALKHALDAIPAKSKKPGYVIFMTDGHPTIGETDPKKILVSTKSTNDTNTRIFALGVGYNVNVQLLDRLVVDNHGVSDYVKPKEPLEDKVSRMYAKVKNPVMTDLEVKVQGVKLTMSYPKRVPDLFDGSQLVMVGRYSCEDAQVLRDGKAMLIITGNYQGKQRGFEFPVKFARPGENVMDSHIERLWAVRRVGYLLDQIQLNGREDKEIIDEIVRLSQKYGIITPYTSFLADERTELADAGEVRRRAKEELVRLGAEVEDAQGQVHAKNRQALNTAERGIVEATVAPAEAAGGPGRPSATVTGYADKDEYEAGRKQTVSNVQQVGNIALYKRGNLWVTADASKLDLEKDAEKIQEVKRYSDKYFELVRQNTAEQNRVLSVQGEKEELLITLRDQAYRIVD